MMRSLYSAISGLKNHQVKMDIIGNNISNVNTTGFKRSQVTFGTMLSQTLRGASSPDPATPPNLGGTNAIQIGLGATLNSVTQIMTQGSTQYTGNTTDMMIQGPGFFVLNNNGTEVYSRAGAFTLDSEGYLVDPGTGALVQGYNFTSDADGTKPDNTNLGPIKIKLGMTGADVSNTDVGAAEELISYSIDQSGVITGVFSDGTTSTTHKIAQIAVASFANDSGLMNVGNNFYVGSNNSGAVTVGAAGDSGRGSIVPNSVEMSNVDLSQEFTDMIVTQRGFQANSRVITVSDSLLQELIDLKRN